MTDANLRLGTIGRSPFLVPVDVATESVGVLGQRGSGKSNALVVLAEELWKAGVPWVAVDPKGDWFGVRSDRAGTGPGLPVPVFGGLHGDLPLEAGAGAVVADLLVDLTLTAVLDVSRFTAADLSRFLVAFCHRLFDRHQAEPQVRTVIFEEAHRYIPQQVTAGTATLKEATAKIPLEGRAFGLGSITASQRSSRLHKDVLTQFSILVAMRSPAKLDRDAIGGWVEEHGVAKELLASLPSLDDGEAWVWSPHTLGIAERVRFRRRETYDSGATPKVGQARKGPRSLADVDLAAIKEQMAESVERAKEQDPAELRRRVAALQRQVKDLQEREPKQVFRTVVPDVLLAELDAVVDVLTEARRTLAERLERMTAELQRFYDEQSGTVVELPDVPPAVVRRAAAAPRPADRPPAQVPNGDVTGPMRKLLAVLATYGPRTKRQLALQAGYSVNGGGFNNPLGRLRSAGYVERGEPIVITEAGTAALGDFDPLPTGPELLAHWLDQLPGPAARILSTLVGHGGALTKNQLAELAGYAANGGGFNNPLGKLRTLELVERGDPVRLTEEFEAALSAV